MRTSVMPACCTSTMARAAPPAPTTTACAPRHCGAYGRGGREAVDVSIAAAELSILEPSVLTHRSSPACVNGNAGEYASRADGDVAAGKARRRQVTRNFEIGLHYSSRAATQVGFSQWP